MGQSNEVLSGDVDSCGVRLARARQQAGVTLEEASARVKMPVRVLRSLENDDWGTGATVFVRGQLRSYARMLGVDIEADLIRAGLSEVAPVELVSHMHTPKYQRLFEQTARRAIYIAITAVIVVPVWLATRPHLSSAPEVQSLEVPGVLAATSDVPVNPVSIRPERTPLIASLAAIRAPVTAPETPDLSLTFNDDSWLQVTGPDGKVIEQALLGNGDKRQFSPKDGVVLVIGNSAAIDATQNGKSVDLTAFSRANVARFRLSSDGSLAPITD